MIVCVRERILIPFERFIRKNYCNVFFFSFNGVFSFFLYSFRFIYVERESRFCRRRVGDFTCDGVISQKKIDASVLMVTRWQIERRKIARIQARMVSCASAFFPSFFSLFLSLFSLFSCVGRTKDIVIHRLHATKYLYI